MADVLPYLVPSGQVVQFSPWTTEDGALLPDVWEGWDANSTVRLHRTVSVDREGLLASAMIPADVGLRVVASWNSSTSQMTMPAGSCNVASSEPLRLEAVLPGNQIGGRVTVTTSLVVADDWVAPPGAAGEAGAVLFQDSTRTAIEGDAGGFPIEVVDFGPTTWDRDASWHLTLDSNLALPFLGAVWLSVNLRDKELIDAISAEKPRPRQGALLESMYADVADQLLEAAQAAERTQGLLGETWPPESLGEVLKTTLINAGLDIPDVPELVGEASEQRTRRQGAIRRIGIGRTFS